MNKLFQETLDNEFKTPTKKSNEIALEFDGLKSKIHIDTARNKRAGRGSTFQIVHRSESSRFQFYKDVSLGIANAVPDLPGTMIFDESTANGMELWFEDVQRSIKGEDGYDFVFVPWFYDENYTLPCGPDFRLEKDELILKDKVREQYKVELSNEQINWYRFCLVHKCGGDAKLRSQEYPSYPEEAFLFSGRPRFDADTLIALKAKCIKPITSIGLLDVYEQFDPLAYYVMGVDTSEGLAIGDNSSVTVINCKTYTQSAHYSGKVAPDILASYIKEWATRYNRALVVVESNNHGLVTLNYLKDIYSRVYFRKSFDNITNEWVEKIGWQTSARTKPLLIGNLDKALRSGLCVKSHQTIDELMTYVISDDGTTNASEGKKDDSVISLALAVQGYLESDKTIPERPKPVLDGTVAKLLEMEKSGNTNNHRYSGNIYRS